MKRTITALWALFTVLTVAAQTDFRHLTYEEGLAVAKSEQKLLFLDFYTDWCGPCKMMMNNVFPKKEVGDYFNAKFVCLKVNAEKEGVDLAKKHEVKAYPTFVVMDAEEKVLGTKVGGNFDSMAFIEEIDRLTDSEKTPERMQQRYESGERSADLVSAYAAYMMEKAREGRRPDKAMMEKAKQMVSDYYDSLTDAQRLSSENLFIFTSFTESVEESAVQYMIANREKFDETSKEKIFEQIDMLYAKQVNLYMSGASLDEKYQDLKQGIKDLGKESDYAMCFQIIDCRAEKGAEGLLEFCEQEYGNMDNDTRNILIQNMVKLVNSDDEAVLQRTSRFIRSQLPDMDLNLIYWAFMQLYEIENPKK